MKIDMHIHTKYSYDGVSEVEEVFDWAERRGLDGVAITDHFDNRAWEEAQKEAEDRDLVFIPGEELRVLDEEGETRCEALVYFLEEPFGNKTIEEIKEEVERQNGLMFMAHPYAKARPAPDDIESFLDHVDGVETVNSRSRLNETNRKAAKLAEENNLPVVGGSDAHMPREVGYAYTEVEDADTLKEFKEGLKKGRSKAKGKITNPFLHYISQIRGRI